VGYWTTASCEAWRTAHSGRWREPIGYQAGTLASAQHPLPTAGSSTKESTMRARHLAFRPATLALLFTPLFAAAVAHPTTARAADLRRTPIGFASVAATAGTDAG